MSSTLRSALLGALLLLAGCAAPPPPPAPLDAAEAAQLETFRRLAFGPGEPAGVSVSGRDHLAKWQQPIRAALVDAPGDRERQVARQHLHDLAALTGLDVAEAPPPSANLLVFFADDPVAAARRHRGLYAHHVADPRRFDRLLAGLADSTCFGFLWGGWPNGRGIDFAVVFLRTDRGARTVEGCLVQQTTQALGLMHDLDAAAETAFNDSGSHIALTESDRVMVRLLYDPRLEPGMAWAETEPLARAALRDLKRGRP